MLKNIHITGLVLLGLATMGFASNLNNTWGTQSISTEDTFYEPVVVLELFTSQGCSSCPSADLLLQKVKEEYKNEVFALSYHVDYWNYIGWKDPFSKAIYAEKQRKYNVKFRNNSNYTPQLVVNGKEHFVGSNSSKMYSSIDTYKEKKSENQVGLKRVHVAKTKISFEYDIQGALTNKRLRILLVLDQQTTKVKRGENRNRALQNSNIVIKESSTVIDEAKGSMEILIPKIANVDDKLNLIVLVENLEYEITGAAKQSLVR